LLARGQKIVLFSKAAERSWSTFKVDFRPLTESQSVRTPYALEVFPKRSLMSAIWTDECAARFTCDYAVRSSLGNFLRWLWWSYKQALVEFKLFEVVVVELQAVCGRIQAFSGGCDRARDRLWSNLSFLRWLW
jgi:hypothetical protein